MINAPDTPPDFERQLALLRARFTAGLGARREELRAGWDDWNAAAATGDGDRPRAVLAIALHRLAGAALSYGFDTLGQHARAFEARITADGAEPGALIEPFATLVAALDEAFAHAAGPGGASDAPPDTPPAPQ